jgi:hypothetical protein
MFSLLKSFLFSRSVEQNEEETLPRRERVMSMAMDEEEDDWLGLNIQPTKNLLQTSSEEEDDDREPIKSEIWMDEKVIRLKKFTRARKNKSKKHRRHH